MNTGCSYTVQAGTLSIHGDLTKQWLSQIAKILQEPLFDVYSVNLRDVGNIDNAGIALLFLLKNHLTEKQPSNDDSATGKDVTWLNVSAEIQEQLELCQKLDKKTSKTQLHNELFIHVGRKAVKHFISVIRIFSFTGELLIAFLKVLVRPGLLRWKDFRNILVSSGFKAIPVIILMGFLFGLILAFQSAIPMRMFGAEIFVGGLVGLALIRELGPIVTAILITGRSGSAFAAEIGTMKVNEELDALETMGLSPVIFLALPRILAGVIAVPVLSLISTVAGLIGGGLVMYLLGFPITVYLNQLNSFVSTSDMIGGLVKAAVFGFFLSAAGCYCGLYTGKDASAVGNSTTSSVVSGIMLISILDGIFAIIFYVLGW